MGGTGLRTNEMAFARDDCRLGSARRADELGWLWLCCEHDASYAEPARAPALAKPRLLGRSLAGLRGEARRDGRPAEEVHVDPRNCPATPFDVARAVALVWPASVASPVAGDELLGHDPARSLGEHARARRAHARDVTD